MIIKTSKWSVLYYFFDNLWHQFFTLILITSSMMTGLNNQLMLLVVFSLIIIKFIKGIFLSKSITIFVDSDKIVVNKKIINSKQVIIKKNEIRGIKVKESFLGRFLHIVDLDIAIKGNLLEEEKIRIKCITQKDKEVILSFISEKANRDNDDFNNEYEWRINVKQILLSSVMSLSWTYIISLVYLREELSDLKKIPFLGYIYNFVEVLFEQKYEVIAYVEIIFVGILLSIIGSIFKYNNFRVNIANETINISRGYLDLYSSSIKINDISSILIKESIFSSVSGYGKLLVEGQIEEEDSLSLTIFPCEKKDKIKFYLEKWFNIQSKQELSVQKRKKLKFLESFLVITFFVLLNVVLKKTLQKKYFFLGIVISLIIVVNVIIKVFFSYVSVDESFFVVFNAGIKSKTTYIKNIDITCIEVENNFIQRILNCSNFQINYISCDEEYSITFKNYYNADIDRMIQIWEKRNEKGFRS